MKKIYDKLFLLIAVLALAGWSALFFVKTGDSPSSESISVAINEEKPYEVVPVPGASRGEVSWPSPKPQSTEWIFDLFTPPKIYIDENGNFIDEPWLAPPPPPPFGVYLSEIVREPFRIQIQGYIEEDRRDSMKSWVLLFDEEREVTLRIRPGSTNDDAAVELTNFVVNREINTQEGLVEVTAKATIRDLRSGRELVLVDGELLYENDITVRLRSEDDATFLAELTQVGESFTGPLGNYILREINLEEGAVVIEKEGIEGVEAETRTLSAVASTSPDQSALEDQPASQPQSFGSPFLF